MRLCSHLTLKMRQVLKKQNRGFFPNIESCSQPRPSFRKNSETWSEKFRTHSKYTILQFATLAVCTKISDESSHIIRTVSDCNKFKQLKRKKASGLIELAMFRLSLNQDQVPVSFVLSAFKAPRQLGKNKSHFHSRVT